MFHLILTVALQGKFSDLWWGEEACQREWGSISERGHPQNRVSSCWIQDVPSTVLRELQEKRYIGTHGSGVTNASICQHSGFWSLIIWRTEKQRRAMVFRIHERQRRCGKRAWPAKTQIDNKSQSWLEVRLPPKVAQLMPRATRPTKMVTQRGEPIWLAIHRDSSVSNALWTLKTHRENSR